MSSRILDPRAVLDDTAIEWEGALIHHSATGQTVTAKQITDYHMKERGWIAAGYHGFISLRRDGTYGFEPGRSLSMAGAHCPGKNKTHLGLCLVGNFSNATPMTMQLDAAAEILAEWCIAFDFGPANIWPHKAYRATDCPGIVDILSLRARVQSILTNG